MSLENNPFVHLFPTPEHAAEYSMQTEKIRDISLESEMKLPEQVEENVEKKIRLSREGLTDNASSVEQDDLVGRIFLITVDHAEKGRNRPDVLVLMENDGDDPLHEAIEQILFERVLLSSPRKLLVYPNATSGINHLAEQEASEELPLPYLLQSYNRLLREENSVAPHLLAMLLKCRRLIIQNLSTVLISPELYSVGHSGSSLSIHQQLYDLLTSTDCADSTNPIRRCLYEVAHHVVEDDITNFDAAFRPVIEKLFQDLISDNFSDLGLSIHLSILIFLTGHPNLAEMLLKHDKPKSVLEIVLSKSCLVRVEQKNVYQFFENVRTMGKRQVEDEEQIIHDKLEKFISMIHISFRQLLKHENTRSVLLTWIGDFLFKHSYLSQTWTYESVDVYAGVSSSDATLLNLSSVLLKLCLPFCPPKQNPTDSSDTSSSKHNTKDLPKFLKIDSSYCLATGLSSEKERTNKGVHGKDMNIDTGLLMHPKENKTAPLQKFPDSYNFISECFFYTHRALYLGIHGLLNKFYRLNRELSHFEGVYRDAMMSGGASNEVSMITEKFERGMRIYLSTKAALTEPSFLGACMRLHATSARYLTQIAITDNMESLAPVQLPISTDAATPLSLYCVPEYVVQNLINLFMFLWRFSRPSLSLVDPFTHDFLLMISIYMGNKSRMSNPHLRASLAELFQQILPFSDPEDDTTYNRESSVQEIFNNFPYLPFLAVAVLQIFVDIEFTGGEHQFEEKFNYRRPLYKILRFMWTRKQCRNKIKDCVKESLANIDDTNHPLFLQFVNLLLNDSIFLLDEAMVYLAQIKTLEQEKEMGEWNELSARERQAKESELKQLGMVTRYHNILSNETMDMLTYLTVSSEVKDLFCHPLLSDRVAAMLNDFLLKLVGPKMGALKVRDFSAYKFKPKVLVMDICRTYVNLCEREDFCHAISRDGRSYSSTLFPSACRVLRRIGEEDLQDKMILISDKIKVMSNQEEEDEELFSDAPDEFYDALMSTLMTDPVILPSSKQVVDRATISRHLMSDPTDPFNRASLTMKEVIPHTELNNKIKEWIDNKRAEKLKVKSERQA